MHVCVCVYLCTVVILLQMTFDINYPTNDTTIQHKCLCRLLSEPGGIGGHVPPLQLFQRWVMCKHRHNADLTLCLLRKCIF